jgi:GR25 family glycosyltransferase involved in LPS biosynthesis
MGSINDYFDGIYCINLDRRPDRWEKNCLPQFEKLGLSVERFSAVDGKTDIDIGHGNYYNAELAGSMSHLNAIKKARDNNIKKLLLLEDDVVFKENANEMFSNLINNVPNDWEYLFFGGNHVGGFTPVSDGVVKLNRSYAIHACGIKQSSYDIMIQHLEHKIGVSINNAKANKPKKSIAADFFLADLQKVLNTYCFLPHIAWQLDGHSDIQGTYMDYDFLRRY